MTRSRISAAKTQYLEEGNTDSNIWDALEDGYTYNFNQANIAREARDEAWTRLNALKNDFTKQVFASMKEVGGLSIPALIAIRSELGIESNIDEYRLDFEARYLRMQEMLDNALKEIAEAD